MSEDRVRHKLIGASPNPYGIIFECTECGKCFASSTEVLNSDSCEPLNTENEHE